MTADFAEWLLQVPDDEREGRVFRVESLYTGRPMQPKRVSRTVSAIGRAAGVVVDRRQGRKGEKVKYAFAHDLRRSFGTRWAPKVKPATLRLLMRHASIETTLRYYVAMDADELADELWAGYSAEAVSGGACTSEPSGRTTLHHGGSHTSCD